MTSANPAKFSIYGLHALDERRALIVALARAAKNLTPAEVRQLRRALFEDEGVSRDEAAALFQLDRAQNAACIEWTEFFVECVTEHVVWQARPTGIINNEQAEWLLGEAGDNPSLPAFALLANVLAEAHRAPQWFVDAVRARAKTPGVRAALAAGGAPGEAVLA